MGKKRPSSSLAFSDLFNALEVRSKAIQTKYSKYSLSNLTSKTFITEARDMQHAINSHGVEIYKIKQLFKLYTSIRKSYFAKTKQKDAIRVLLVGEEWSWRVTGISQNAILEYAKHNFEKCDARSLSRHHYKKSFAETAEEMLKNTLPINEWWELLYENEVVHLVTEIEHNNGKSSKIIDIDFDKGLFRNRNIGWCYQKKEIEFLKSLNLADG